MMSFMSNKPNLLILSIYAISLAGTCGCATRPELTPTRVESDWVQPQVDEVAGRAAACIRGDVDRLVEIEASREGVVRGWVLPYPGAAEQQECVDREALSLRVQPSNTATRSLMGGDGRRDGGAGARVRALSLRARAMDQLPPVHACAGAWQTRQPGKSGRVALSIDVGREGEVTRAEVALSTADDEAARCVLAAARALRLPSIPGTYRYSYWLTPREVVVGAPDVSPVDPWELAAALATIAPVTDECVRHYSVGGDLTFFFTVGETGLVSAARVERSAGRPDSVEEDRACDACATKALRTLRLPPFDGGARELSVPYKLR